MDAVTGGIQAIGTYLFQVGESVVVGTSNALVTLGSGTVSALKAVFQGIRIGA